MVLSSRDENPGGLPANLEAVDIGRVRHKLLYAKRKSRHRNVTISAAKLPPQKKPALATAAVETFHRETAPSEAISHN
jgi:hypothetical protein